MSGQRKPSSSECVQSSDKCGPSDSRISNRMMSSSSSLEDKVDRKPEQRDKMENFNREGLKGDSSNNESESKSHLGGDRPDSPTVYGSVWGGSSPVGGSENARVDDTGITRKDQSGPGADQPKVGDLSDSTTMEDGQSCEHLWISTKGYVEDHTSSKDNLPSEDLAQEQPSAFQPNSLETTSRFGAVGDGAKRANFASTVKMQHYGERRMNCQQYFEEEQGLGLSDLWVRMTAKSVWLDFALVDISQAKINEDGFTQYDIPDDGDQTLKNIWSSAEFEYNVQSSCSFCPEYLSPVSDIIDIMDSKLCQQYFLPKELEEEILEYEENEDMETPTELGSKDI